MNDKVKGFVLSISDYKENDSIIQVITKEYGHLSLVAKASKKLDSKNHFLPMCIYEIIIDYKDNKTIYTIKGSKLINNYFEDKDIDMMSFKNILLELTLKNKDIDTYNELCFVFDRLNIENKYLLGSMYITYITKLFGIMPMVDGCAVCGNKKVVSISNTQGGFLCINHLNGQTCFDVETLKKFRLMVKASFENYDILKQFDYDKNDFYILMNFYLENADMKIKAYDFYRTLN